MGGAKRQLEEEAERAHEEYVKESICPKCGDEREEITLDHNTFWLCDQCDGDHERREREMDEINDMPPEDDDLWGLGGKDRPAPPKNDVVMVPVPSALAKDVIQGVAERIWYHVDGLKDNPLDAESLAAVNTLTAFVKQLQTLFPEVAVEF
jgi:hypothetical protein